MIFFFLSSLFAYFLGDGLLSNHGLGFGRSVTLMLVEYHFLPEN